MFNINKMKRSKQHVKINIFKKMFNNSKWIFNKLFNLSHNKRNTKIYNSIKLTKIYPT